MVQPACGVHFEDDVRTSSYCIRAPHGTELRHQDETGASPEELDASVTEHAGMPMGPFRVADMSGLDTVVKVARDMYDAYGDRFHVPRRMEELVSEGHLGAKTGKGFYEH